MVGRTTVSPDGMNTRSRCARACDGNNGRPVVSEDLRGVAQALGTNPSTNSSWRIPRDRARRQQGFHPGARRRFGPVLDALRKPSNNVPSMMPAGIASTTAEDQIKDSSAPERSSHSAACSVRRLDLIGSGLSTTRLSNSAFTEGEMMGCSGKRSMGSYQGCFPTTPSWTDRARS
jgi:hypothetical protein